MVAELAHEPKVLNSIPAITQSLSGEHPDRQHRKHLHEEGVQLLKSSQPGQSGLKEENLALWPCCSPGSHFNTEVKQPRAWSEI